VDIRVAAFSLPLPTVEIGIRRLAEAVAAAMRKSATLTFPTAS
jgi:hypothetical protein